MRDFANLGQYSNKIKIAITLAIIAGLAFAIIKSADFIISSRYLQLEIYYLIGSILNNNLLLLLLTASVVVSIFNFLPVIRDSSQFINRLKSAMTIGISAGLLFGMIKIASLVISNRYVQYDMYYIIFYYTSSILTYCLLATAGTTLVVFFVLPVVSHFLGFLKVDMKAINIVISGILPSLLILIVVGYSINKQYLPAFFATKSIIGNATWFLVCLFLVWVIGWIIVKLSQISLPFSLRVPGIKALICLISLVVFLGVANYVVLQSVRTGRPNLILISIDTLRADHLSNYGYYRNTTPGIQLFARDSTQFSDTIAQASWTLPSHISLLTGLYASSHRVETPVSKLTNEHLTLAEILQNAGYETVAFTDGGYVSHRFGYQGFDRFDDIGYGRYDKQEAIRNTYIKAVNWLKKNHSRRFFLFLHTYQVHCPYDTPPDYDIYSDKNYDGTIDVSRGCATYYNVRKNRMNPKDYQYVIDKYDGLILYTDHVLGKLFTELKHLGLYDNSVIIVTSDHGENFLDHTAYAIGHEQLYDEIIKVPLIIKAPEFPRNQVIDAQVESIDIMPTALDLLGISISNKMDGMSLVGLVKGGSYDKVFAFSENLRHSPQKIIRRNDWKLFYRTQEKLELYDLKNDPKEKRNLYSANKEVTRSLYGTLQSWAETQDEKAKLFSTDEIQLDNELTEKLKALGYVN